MARVRQFEDDTDTAIERFFDWAPAAEDTVAQGQMHNWLRRCLGELKAGERQALVLAPCTDSAMATWPTSEQAAGNDQVVAATRGSKPARLRRTLHGAAVARCQRALDALCGEATCWGRCEVQRAGASTPAREPSVASRLACWQATLLPGMARRWKLNSLRTGLAEPAERPPPRRFPRTAAVASGFLAWARGSRYRRPELLLAVPVLPLMAEPPCAAHCPARVGRARHASAAPRCRATGAPWPCRASGRCRQGRSKPELVCCRPTAGRRSRLRCSPRSTRVPVPEIPGADGRRCEAGGLRSSRAGSPTGAPTGPVIMVGSIGTV